MPHMPFSIALLAHPSPRGLDRRLDEKDPPRVFGSAGLGVVELDSIPQDAQITAAPAPVLLGKLVWARVIR